LRQRVFERPVRLLTLERAKEDAEEDQGDTAPDGVSEQTLYNWRKQYGAMAVDEVRRLRQLEQENARLKKLLAERDLEIEVMKEIAAKVLNFAVDPRTEVGRDGALRRHRAVQARNAQAEMPGSCPIGSAR